MLFQERDLESVLTGLKPTFSLGPWRLDTSLFEILFQERSHMSSQTPPVVQSPSDEALTPQRGRGSLSQVVLVLTPDSMLPVNE